jgi:hypothetical protein
MSGIRLHHPTYRAAEGATLTYVVELPLDFKVNASGQSRADKPCGTCQKTHARKSLHLRLDGNGDVIVSKTIFNRLKTVPLMAGMELVGEVDKPPAVRIGAVDLDKQRIIEAPLNRDNAAAATIKPGATKYEAERRIWSPFRPIFESLLEHDDREQTKKRREKRTLFVPTRKA